MRIALDRAPATISSRRSSANALPVVTIAIPAATERAYIARLLGVFGGCGGG
jgi:hypothetical protein